MTSVPCECAIASGSSDARSRRPRVPYTATEPGMRSEGREGGTLATYSKGITMPSAMTMGNRNRVIAGGGIAAAAAADCRLPSVRPRPDERSALGGGWPGLARRSHAEPLVSGE